MDKDKDRTKKVQGQTRTGQLKDKDRMVQEQDKIRARRGQQHRIKTEQAQQVDGKRALKDKNYEIKKNCQIFCTK
jgi:hypothetical protein